FRKESFYPCYGLAEATLFVTGGWLRTGSSAGQSDAGHQAVSCGSAHGADAVLIVDPDTRVPCPAGATGEVWITGPTVTHGYWRRDEDTTQTFRSRLATGDA